MIVCISNFLVEMVTMLDRTVHANGFILAGIIFEVETYSLTISAPQSEVRRANPVLHGDMRIS
jgi:hypothetical protein